MFCSPEISMEKNYPSTSSQKVMVIGLDGGTFNLIDPYIREG
jgi:hypothetical protein